VTPKFQVGIDTIEIRRISEILEKCPGFRHRWFNSNESLLSSKKMAGSLAAKKALYKSLGGQLYFDYSKVTLLHDEFGKPKFEFYDGGSFLNSHLCYSISITYTTETAQAIAITQLSEAASDDNLR